MTELLKEITENCMYIQDPFHEYAFKTSKPSGNVPTLKHLESRDKRKMMYSPKRVAEVGMSLRTVKRSKNKNPSLRDECKRSPDPRAPNQCGNQKPAGECKYLYSLPSNGEKKIQRNKGITA